MLQPNTYRAPASAVCDVGTVAKGREPPAAVEAAISAVSEAYAVPAATPKKLSTVHAGNRTRGPTTSGAIRPALAQEG